MRLDCMQPSTQLLYKTNTHVKRKQCMKIMAVTFLLYISYFDRLIETVSSPTALVLHLLELHYSFAAAAVTVLATNIFNSSKYSLLMDKEIEHFFLCHLFNKLQSINRKKST